MAKSKLERLLEMLTLIRSRETWKPGMLAQHFGVTERSVFRDIKTLRRAGFEVVHDRRSGCYRLSGNAFLPPVQLTVTEAMAMAVLCEHVAHPEQIPFTGEAWRGLKKIEGALPGEIREEVDRLTERVVVKMGAVAPMEGSEDSYKMVQEAIASQRALVCRYEAANSSSARVDGEDGDFDFEPYALFFAVRAWYAVGYHAGRDAIRTLKLNRFSSLRRTERPFEIPGDFSLETYLGNAWRMMPGEREYDVELEFDASFAETIADTRWHPTQRVEKRADGSAVFRCRVSGLDEIVWWVLSMGPHCRVVEPAELRDRLVGLARGVCELYE